MKIPLQDKIAELEARINDLEREAELHWGFAPKENLWRALEQDVGRIPFDDEGRIQVRTPEKNVP